jgi:MFS family permease
MKKGEKVSEKELKHKTRRLSIKEGIFWSVKASFGDHYVAPFAIAMQMSNSLVAILNSLWNLNPISQLWGSKFVGKYKRKNVLMKTISVDALGWLFMAMIGILYFLNIKRTILPYFLIADFALILLAGGLGHPSWFSWMGDVVDAKFRGRWFSKRNTIISFTTIILAISAALILSSLKNSGKEMIGFIILFGIAFLARAYCVKIIGKHYEPKFKKRKRKKLYLKKFIQESRKTNFGKFTLFRGIFALTIGITSPLTAIYLLRILQFDYLTYIIIILSGTFFSIITLNLWGKIADKYGNYRVIAITTLIIPLTPLLWILSPSKIYLFLVPAILGGTAWTAFIMASGNFIYDNVLKRNLGNAISYFNLFIGIGAFIGGLIGAILIKTIQTTWIEPIFFIFIIGTLARMIVVGLWMPKLREIKNKRKFKNIENFKDIILKEAKPTIVEDMHEIAAIKDYIVEK